MYKRVDKRVRLCRVSVLVGEETSETCHGDPANHDDGHCDSELLGNIYSRGVEGNGMVVVDGARVLSG